VETDEMACRKKPPDESKLLQVGTGGKMVPMVVEVVSVGARHGL
jgi:hypothetical protein